jgi:hypothetical protein
MKQLITKILLKILWKISDDPTHTSDYFYRLYRDVPKEFESEYVDIYYFYVYKNKNRKKILKWLSD